MSAPSPGHEVVVDTNVVLKFFIEEANSDKADVLLESFLRGTTRLVTLDFLFIEFVNVLWLKTRRGELTPKEAAEKIMQLIALSSLMEVPES
jgi:predicted nucleic acid-binding protein